MISSREKRWAVITSDGGHSWLGRDTDPSEADIATVTAQLAGKVSGAWLAITEGVYYQPEDDVTVLMVRQLVGEGGWEEAKAAFLARRSEALKRG